MIAILDLIRETIWVMHNVQANQDHIVKARWAVSDQMKNLKQIFSTIVRLCMIRENLSNKKASMTLNRTIN